MDRHYSVTAYIKWDLGSPKQNSFWLFIYYVEVRLVEAFDFCLLAFTYSFIF